MASRPNGTPSAPPGLVAPSELRARFATALSRMYSKEVPAYGLLLRTCDAINREVAEQRDGQLSNEALTRITEERHGAIRVGSPAELRAVARLFRLMGMQPVGYYDLREAATKAVPVVSTAFRPVHPEALEKSAFRVFTSLLVTNDRRFFDRQTQNAIEDHVRRRRLMDPSLAALLDRAERRGGVDTTEADEFIAGAVRTFELDHANLDLGWYERLHAVSPVAADIGAGPGTHVNHLTPRVLDIDELYRRMEAQGVRMIDRIQGPPRWAGPPLLLRQTSFRALDEPRMMKTPQGSVEQRFVRVRFGEVEARGAALTTGGRNRVDALLTRIDSETHGTEAARQDAAARLFDSELPHDLAGLFEQGLAYVEFHAQPGSRPTRTPDPTLRDLIDGGFLQMRPITYEDFLPKSAAGIFQSNLDTDGTRRSDMTGAGTDATSLEEAMGKPILDPYALYEEQQRRSLEAALDELKHRHHARHRPVTQ